MILGLDIGGANLKAATADGRAASTAFPLWKSPEKLAAALAALIKPFGDCEQLAVTMTGELADCFATKAEGVARILESVAEVAAGRSLRVWTTDGRWVTPAVAQPEWQAVAAANWHALATWAGREFAPQGRALVIDIGSTTTDIIPLTDGVPCPQGKTDLARLLSGELLYTGVRRTPVCAVRETVALRGRTCPLAAELFATTLDAHLITGRIEPNAEDLDTADGRPATMEHARRRLAHMVCCDESELTADELRALAEQFAAAQIQQIQAALETVCRRQPGALSTVVLSGSGSFLTREMLAGRFDSEAAIVDLSAKLSPQIAEAACAYAVANLAVEAVGDRDSD